MDPYLSQVYQHYVKCKQLCPEFEPWSPCPFPMIMTVIPQALLNLCWSLCIINLLNDYPNFLKDILKIYSQLKSKLCWYIRFCYRLCKFSYDGHFYNWRHSLCNGYHQEMKSLTWVQILDEVVCVSLCAIIFEKSLNLSLLLPATGK